MHEITREYEGARLGDPRRSRRLMRMVSRIASAPKARWSEAMQGDAEREGAYRFLNNEQVKAERVLDPHVAQTCRRAAKHEDVVVAHDTSHFRFSTERDGLGRGTRHEEEHRVFYGHVSLALSADGKREPLGCLGWRPMVRTGKPLPRAQARKTHHKAESQRESYRWYQAIRASEEHLKGSSSAIHVMDREADQYLLMARMVAKGWRFVIRAKKTRAVIDERLKHCPRLDFSMQREPVRFVREVPTVSKGGRVTTRMRQATLEVRAQSVTLSQSATTAVRTRFAMPDTLPLRAVQVSEVDTPAGQQPVHWMLLSTEPIETDEDIARIIDIYRSRWVIEEYFKALKTGCGFESQQLEHADALFRALSIFLPIAWHMLALRHQARHTPEREASTVLSPLQLRLLQSHPQAQLHKRPTVQQALVAIAKLGGFLDKGGPPGWLTLGRGFLKLRDLELGASLLLNHSDFSP